jgi:serine/threonine protein kinase/tetratricopeptide (TPR) repeat protein
MRSLICPGCGASNSELNNACATCGAPLPDPDSTLVNGAIHPQGPPAGGDGQDGEDRDELHPGQQISHFRILGRIGKGGMGIVYRARDLKLGREVALKFLHERRRRGLDRFQREAEALAALDHPNIGTIYEIVKWKGRPFIAMALYPGETLAQRLARQPDRRLPEAEAVPIASQLAAALQAAHGAGLVHRDLKPDNVMILPDGWVKLIDFGLARWAGSPRQTDQGFAVGTLRYMAPEQLRSEEPTPAADLWGLGVVLYEMLAGRHPFHGEGYAMVQSILSEEPSPLRKACPQVPAVLEKIVARCLAKEPTDRWPSAADILAELQAAGSSGSGTSNPVPPPVPRVTWRLWLGVAVAIFLLSLAVGIVWRITHPPLVYVAVLQPEVSSSLQLQPDDEARVKINLRATLLRTVALLDGLIAQDPLAVDEVRGTPRFVARALGAGELITSLVYCNGDECRVTLRRIDGETGKELWTTTEEGGLHPSNPRRFAKMVTDLLRQGYRNRKLRVPQLGLKAGDAEYRTYIELLQRNADPAVKAPKELKELLAQLKALRQRAPDFLEVYLLESAVLRRLSGSTQSLDQAIEMAKQAQTLAPQDPRPLKDLADLYIAVGLYPEAGWALDKLAKVDPAGSLFRRGQLEERQGHPKEALKLMAKAASRHPSWKVLLMLAIREYQLGRLEEARDHFKALLKLEPDNPQGRQGLNQIELLLDPKGAVERLREAAKRDRGPDSLINLGDGLLWLRQYAEAAENLRRALELKPDDPSAALNLADCLLLLNRPQEAQTYYSRVAAITENTSPSDWQRLSVRAQALAHLGQAEKADTTMQTALSVVPDSPQLACEAAMVYVTLGRTHLALSYARRAAAGPAAAYCLGFPQFDPLRHNPGFPKLEAP